MLDFQVQTSLDYKKSKLATSLTYVANAQHDTLDTYTHVTHLTKLTNPVQAFVVSSNDTVIHLKFI